MNFMQSFVLSFRKMIDSSDVSAEISALQFSKILRRVQRMTHRGPPAEFNCKHETGGNDS